MDLIYNSKYYDSKLEKEIDFKYRTELTLQQKVSFVNFVLGVIFDDDYCFSIIKNEVFDIALIYMFTDVLQYEEDFTFSLNNIEEMLNTTNVIEILKKEIDNDLIKDLNEVIDINIAYKTGVNVNSISTSFSSLLKTIENKVSDFDVDEFSNTLKKFGDITNGMSPDKIMELYTKTDAYKKNYKGTLSTKNKQIRELKKEINNNNNNNNNK